MTLNQMAVGSKACIIFIHGEGALRRRLLEMGLIPKTIVEVNRMAPMGDPIELFVRNYSISLRRIDAELIEVELIDI